MSDFADYDRRIDRRSENLGGNTFDNNAAFEKGHSKFQFDPFVRIKQIRFGHAPRAAHKV